ncbi:ubiquitin domain-containing protein UBFD1-like isoform X2 [Ostrea edulis]|uniref:ubiquitin domain-containing protein UBFD1-like isoform X2 n=1 Tax=Ostrea edulis TaxID=37623 RepID=UPI00209658CB|nr:ubiquitin domain-containing protein UBFD1-like isoform X2 [Ostrea edulis]
MCKVVQTDEKSNLMKATEDSQQPSDPGGNENNEKTKSDENHCKTNSDSTKPSDHDHVETVDFKIVYNKQKYDVTFPTHETVAKLKAHVQTLTGVPSAMQKIMYKGLAKDESTLKDLKVTKGAKIMVVGSTLNDVLSVSKPSPQELQEAAKASAATKEPLSQQKEHKRVLDKHGKPDDVPVGIKNMKEPLPHTPLSGMYNKSGGKVRLTFKLEVDQLWLGTKERTEKIPMNSIKAVVSEAIKDHEEYHMLGIQLGPTEASRYWIYWVPAQYVDAIKDTILGKWQYF